jgi:hypothetical protein
VNFRLLGYSWFWAVVLKSNQFFGQLFPRSKSCVDFDKKMGWATF